jgi:outer membrane receptor protein involved in Fe transport
MQAFVRITTLLCVLAAATAGPVLAQATGRIDGLVTDQSASVLPGVTLDITNEGTGQTRTAVTGADGLYTVPQLAPGRYRVTATLAGFKSVVRDGITVNVNQTSRVDLQLEVGAQEETITVTSDVPLVETRQATLGVVIDERQIVELPLNGRNFTQLGTLIPGVVAQPAALGGLAGDATPGGFGNTTGAFNVNGMRSQSNNFLLDGASNNDTFNTGFVLRPPPDAIQEFKILTHSFGAEYGRNAGSVVNVVTRSGTNEWRGAAWEFNRDDALQARNFFAPSSQPKPKLKQNQFGGALGGPLLRNKLFGFGYYEGFRNQSGITQTIAVLTPAQRRGDFSALATPLRDPLTVGGVFPGNQIPANRLDPIALRLVDEFVPLPNVGSNLYTVSPTVEDNRDQVGFRGDLRIGDRHTVLGRYMWSQTERLTPRTVQPVDQVATATLQDFMAAHTFLVGSSMINVARVSYNRISANPQVTSGLTNADYGINLPNTNPAATGLPSIAVTGFFTGGTALGDLQQPFVDRKNEVFQLADDFTWLAGRHSLKFGFDVRREGMTIAFINRPNGDLTFNGSLSGNAAADFLLGFASQARATTTQAIQDGHGWAYAGYVQDEFRVSSRLTLNLGVRYELTQPFVDANDAIAGFATGVQSQVFPAAPTGLVYGGDPGVPRGIVPTDKNNLAPRLSAVWDPVGDGRTSVRGAWGIFYDALAGQGDFFQSGVLAPPFTPLIELNAPTRITLRDPLASVAGGPNPFPPALTIIGWGTDFETPYAHHFNLTLQREVWRNIGVEVGYVGSRGHNLPIFMEVNPGVLAPGQTARGARIMPAFALVRPTFSVARSWYDSLQASARMRPTAGFSFLAAYTWSHTTDHVSGLNIANAEQPRPVLPVAQGDEASIEAALAQEKGDALFDVRHRLVLSFGYELPRLDGQGALLRSLAGGWQVNGIFQAQTGFPFTVLDANLDIRYLTNRPNVTCDPNDGPRTTAQWFDTTCFTRRSVPETGQALSNQGRNTVRGPGFNRTDLSLFKNFALPRQHQIQVRVEAFNVFNQTRFGQPGFSIGTPLFGVISSAEDGRIVQLGIKYTF